MNIFDCAIKIEEEAKQYYQKLGAKSSEPEMKHLFSMLAASEDELKEKILQLKRSVGPEQAQIKELDQKACRFRPVLTERELMEQAENDPDFYKTSMREEEQEIKFYEDLAAQTKDPATRSCIERLAEEERRHMIMMENIYEFVESPKTFLAWGEFSNLRDL